MRALTFHGKQTVHYESVSDPILEAPTDVLVKIRLAAICGSDLHPYHEREKGLDAGTVMGHEFVGEIVEVGSAVRSLSPGDVVLCPFTTNCGTCFYCLRGLTCRCVSGQLFGWRQEGKGLHGGQAEYVRVPLADSTLLKLPEGVALEEGLFLGDIFSTGYFCADMAEIAPEGVYAVLGCGPVGLMAIASTRELGAERVYAIDSVSERLQLAESFGARPIDFENEDPVGMIRESTDGRGADGVLEVVGSAAATALAVELVRPGGIISAAGFHTEERFAFSPGTAYDKNLTYKAGRCPARHYMERLVPLVQEKKYPLPSVITHRLPLSQGVEAYGIFDRKLEGCVKVLLTP